MNISSRTNENRQKTPERITPGDKRQLSNYEYAIDRGVYNINTSLWTIRNTANPAGKFVTAEAFDAPVPAPANDVAVPQGQVEYIDYISAGLTEAQQYANTQTTQQPNHDHIETGLSDAQAYIDADANERARQARLLAEQAHQGNGPELANV